MTKDLKDSCSPAESNGDQVQVRQPTELGSWRSKILNARSGSELLNSILDPHDAADLVPKLSTDDLFSCIRTIGLADSEAVLALASGQQVQGLIDSDCWSRDTFEVDRVDPWLNALMAAGPDVLGAKVMAQDDALINLLMQASIRVIVVEEPDDFQPPDEEHVVTPDGSLCICFPASAPRDLPIKIFLDWLMRNNPLLATNYLIHLPAALKSNLEEEAYRWRSGRMADRGYIDYYDALKIYVPASESELRTAENATEISTPVTGHWMVAFQEADNRLQAALAAVESTNIDAVQSSLAVAMNMALSADRVELWDEEHQDEIVTRVQAGLVLALNVLNGTTSTPAADAQLLTRVPISVLFRIGYGRILDAASAIRSSAIGRRLRGDGGRVDGVDIPELKPWAEWLTARHPSMPNGVSPMSLSDLEKMSELAELIADLARVGGLDRPMDVGLGQYLLTRLSSALLGLETDAPLPRDQLINAHALFIEDESLSERTKDAAYIWWLEQSGRSRKSVDCLLALANEELAGVAIGALDPRFARVFWIDEAHG